MPLLLLPLLSFLREILLGRHEFRSIHWIGCFLHFNIIKLAHHGIFVENCRERLLPHMCFNESNEDEFTIERDDELLHISDDGRCIEILGDAAAHSANRFKSVLEHFDRGCVELVGIRDELVCAAAEDVETFGLYFDEFLQCFVNYERIGLPKVLQ